jgi:ATP-dependent RNA helicase DDX10/DBP4
MVMQSGATASLGAQQSDDGGYISPEFDLPDLPTDDEEEMAAPPSKKTKFGSSFSSKTENKSTDKYLLDEEEELALRLLGRS